MPSSLSRVRTHLLRNRRHHGYGRNHSITAADLSQRRALRVAQAVAQSQLPFLHDWFSGHFLPSVRSYEQGVRVSRPYDRSLPAGRLLMFRRHGLVPVRHWSRAGVRARARMAGDEARQPHAGGCVPAGKAMRRHLLCGWHYHFVDDTGNRHGRRADYYNRRFTAAFGDRCRRPAFRESWIGDWPAHAIKRRARSDQPGLLATLLLRWFVDADRDFAPLVADDCARFAV